jgi:hypothetical protein
VRREVDRFVPGIGRPIVEYRAPIPPLSTIFFSSGHFFSGGIIAGAKDYRRT